mgnify:FL=1|nr:hypothetical protein [uncultured Fretibacterium sp.]
MELKALLRGELWLTFDILLGLLIGDLVLRWGLADRLMRRMMPWLRRHGIGPLVGLALTLSLGSAKAGAAVLASALSEGRIDRHTALWGTLSLAFPAYLRRWPATLVLSVSMTGLVGGIFALVLILRSLVRFALVVCVLRSRESGELPLEEAPGRRRMGWGFYRKLGVTLPLAWFFYAVAFALVPYAESAFRRWFMGGSFLPLAGWAVAAASVAHVSAALALTGGSLAAGELSAAQAVFALLLGNGLGIVTRALRQNAGYYFGLFPAGLARSMLFWNVGTVALLTGLSLALAAVPLLLG